MSNVVPFPRVNGAYASGHSMPAVSDPERDEIARMNFYSAERRAGADPDTADARAEVFVRSLERVRQIMKEPS